MVIQAYPAQRLFANLSAIMTRPGPRARAMHVVARPFIPISKLFLKFFDGYGLIGPGCYHTDEK